MKKTLEDKLELLNRETESIVDDLSSIDSEYLVKSGRGWSIIQVLSHLELAESASLRYMEKKINAGDSMPRVKSIYKFKMWVTARFLESKLKWKAPKPVSNPKGDYSLQEITEKWKESRNRIHEFVKDYPEKWLNRAVYKHPMAGRQGLNEAIDSFIYHQRHHKHQINRIRKELNI